MKNYFLATILGLFALPLLAQKTKCIIPEDPLGKKAVIEIRKSKEKATIRINDYLPAEYIFAPGEAEDFPSANYEAIFSDLKLVKVGEPCQLMIVAMTIRNVKKATKIYHYKADPVLPPPPEEIEKEVEAKINRQIEVAGALEIKSKTIKIIVWDNQSVDGDIISVYLNGEPIVQELTLAKEPKVYEATLSKEVNMLTLYAHNLGKSPPNTAAITIDDGVMQQTKILSSNMQKSEALQLVVKL